MRSNVESKDLISAYNWESVRCHYFRQLGHTDYADKLQALADYYFQKICEPEKEEGKDNADGET